MFNDEEIKDNIDNTGDALQNDIDEIKTFSDEAAEQGEAVPEGNEPEEKHVAFRPSLDDDESRKGA